MPTYRYTGAYPKHLHGLTHGVNAQHHPADGSEPTPGTVTASLGDHITTAEPYEHPDLKELTEAEWLAEGLGTVAKAGRRGADGIKALRAAAEDAKQATDEETRMTAEGAPAPHTDQES